MNIAPGLPYFQSIAQSESLDLSSKNFADKVQNVLQKTFEEMQRDNSYPIQTLLEKHKTVKPYEFIPKNFKGSTVSNKELPDIATLENENFHQILLNEHSELAKLPLALSFHIRRELFLAFLQKQHPSFQIVLASAFFLSFVSFSTLGKIPSLKIPSMVVPFILLLTIRCINLPIQIEKESYQLAAKFSDKKEIEESMDYIQKNQNFILCLGKDTILNILKEALETKEKGSLNV